MFLIEGLHHKLVNKTKTSSLPRHLKTERRRFMYAMDKMKTRFACVKCMHMLYVFKEFAEDSDGNGHIQTHSTQQHLAYKHQHHYSEQLIGQTLPLAAASGNPPE